MNKISPFTNVGLTWKGENGHTYKFRRRGNPRIKIRLTTFVGMLAASHFYCRVIGKRPEIHDETERRWLYLGGYGSECPSLSDFEFNVEYEVNNAQKGMDGVTVTCWSDYKGSGEITSQFIDPEFAVRCGITLVAEKFRDTPSKHWIVSFDGPFGEYFDEAEFRLSDLDPDKIIKKIQWEF